MASKKFAYSMAQSAQETGNCPGLCWYWFSDWALAQLEKEGHNAVAKARQLAEEARTIGALQMRSDASPYQPALANLYDLVLAFGQDGGAWAVRRLRRMAWSLSSYIQEEGIYAQPWNTQYSRLDDFRCAFRVLTAGLAETLHTELPKAEIRQALRKEDVGFFLIPAVGEKFVKAVFQPEEAEVRFQFVWLNESGEVTGGGGYATSEEVSAMRERGDRIEVRSYLVGDQDGSYVSRPEHPGFPGVLGW